MTELLHLSALLPAAFGVCCTVGGRRGSRGLSAFEGLAAVAMFAAMADVALGLSFVAPILWIAGLIAFALVGLPLGRSHVPVRNVSATHAPLLHTSLGLIVMAGLIAVMSTGHVASAASHHSASGLLPTFVLGGSAVFVGYSAWRAITLYRLPRRNLIGCLEAASMTASVALMAGALAV
jgi:hypothetical protein